jgi:hypothetical protein
MKIQLVLLGLTLVGSLNAAELTFAGDFEKGDLSGFTGSGNPPSVATNLAAGGKYSANFDLTRDMKTPYRTEVTVTGEPGRFQWSTEYWVGFSFRLEEWATDKDMEIAPFQIHATPADWNDHEPKSQISSGPVMMAVQDGEMRVYTYGGKIGWHAPVVQGKWIHMTLRFIPSFRDDGLIELWKDGAKIVSVARANTWELDHNGKPMRPMYWKMGVYKWNWKEGRPATDSSRRQLFIDDFKIAKGTNGYALVSPNTPQIPAQEAKAR